MLGRQLHVTRPCGDIGGGVALGLGAFHGQYVHPHQPTSIVSKDAHNQTNQEIDLKFSAIFIGEMFY